METVGINPSYTVLDMKILFLQMLFLPTANTLDSELDMGINAQPLIASMNSIKGSLPFIVHNLQYIRFQYSINGKKGTGKCGDVLKVMDLKTLLAN